MRTVKILLSPDVSGSAPPQAVFITTHWSLILAARDADPTQSRAALEKLCQAYYFPLYAYVRRLGNPAHDAEDLTQAFFERLLEKDYLATADQAKGRFRTFLLTAMKRFLAKEWRRAHAQKRGGFRTFVAADGAWAESRFESATADRISPERLYEQEWARTLLDRTMVRLREEYAATGRAALFEQLNGCLAKTKDGDRYGDLAKRLHLTEAAVKVAVYRLRKRYRELLRLEISDTVADPEAVEDELRHLFSVFAR